MYVCVYVCMYVCVYVYVCVCVILYYDAISCNIYKQPYRHYFEIGGTPIDFFVFFGRLGQPVYFQDVSRIKSYNSNITSAQTYTGSQMVCNSPTSTKSIGRSSLSFALDSKRSFKLQSPLLSPSSSYPAQTLRRSPKVLVWQRLAQNQISF